MFHSTLLPRYNDIWFNKYTLIWTWEEHVLMHALKKEIRKFNVTVAAIMNSVAIMPM